MFRRPRRERRGPTGDWLHRLGAGAICLTTWCGKTMLACRSEVFEEYRDGPLALVFRLARGRFIVGYALGGSGMLFRCELLTGHLEEEARAAARQLADDWAERGAEDESRREEEQD